MRVRFLFTLGIVAVSWAPAAAQIRAPSYSIEDLQGIARAAHPTLAAAESGIEQAEGLLRRARSYPNPTLNVAGGRGRPRDGGESKAESSFQLTQPIELPGVRKWRARVAELGLHRSEVERALARSVVDAAAARLAFTVLGGRRRVEIARESADVAVRLQRLLERRVELGESPPLEAVKARAEWFARRRDLIDAEGALRAARSALNVLCGGRLEAGYEVTEPGDPEAPAELPADLLARMAADSPVLHRARIALDTAEAAAESERKGIPPRINVLAAHERELDRTGTSVGVGISLPLWNRNRGAVEAALANRSRLSAEADALLYDLEARLAQVAADYERARAAIELHRTGWTDAAAESLRIATFSYENGEASLLDVLDAQRANLEVRLAEADSWTTLRTARTEIEVLIGGPLEPEAHDETR
jgi:cobalt-zinc-cadmium efflux system outer membrane protein